MNDDKYMAIAIAEARKGQGRTSPNPCVGAVITRDGEIVSKGYHRKAGKPHAEREAIAAASRENRNLSGTTLYVTLEPCNHTGRTPPCTEAILETGISRVVVGMLDPNPIVDGSGIERLRGAGVEVTCGVMEEECKDLNRPFITSVTHGRPWIVMKAGVSLDGRLNYRRGNGGAITGATARQEVHKLRDRLDAILVGWKTVAIDNPSLTARIPGKKTQDPVRVIVDSRLELSPDAPVFSLASDSPTWVVCAESADQSRCDFFLEKGIPLLKIPVKSGELDLTLLMKNLLQKGICSVLVEGGGGVHGSFLRQKLVDFAYLFYAPIFAGNGGVSLVEHICGESREVVPQLLAYKVKRLGNDFLVSGAVHFP